MNVTVKFEWSCPIHKFKRFTAILSVLTSGNLKLFSKCRLRFEDYTGCVTFALLSILSLAGLDR